MSKRFSKILLTLLLLIVIITSFSLCFATDGEVSNTATENSSESTTNSTETSTEGTDSEQEIYSGDLYLFDDKIVMDQLVDGNVFIFGKDVQITGQVNGNLYVLANKVTFGATPEETANGIEYNTYIRYSIFACAKEITINDIISELKSKRSRINNKLIQKAY